MNSVDDLNMTKNQPTQTVSLSDIAGDNSGNKSSKISINAITGEGLTDKSSKISINTITGEGLDEVSSNMITEQQRTAPVIKINPNGKRVPRRRVASSANSNMKAVNPDEIIEKPEIPKAPTVEDIAMGELDRAVARKKAEYREFVERAIKDDEINRERVAAGLETVNEEMQYIPDALHKPMKDEDRVDYIPEGSQIEYYDEDEEFEELDEYLDDEEEFDNEISSHNYSELNNVRVNSNPFDFNEEEEIEDNDDMLPPLDRAINEYYNEHEEEYDEKLIEIESSDIIGVQNNEDGEMIESEDDYEESIEYENIKEDNVNDDGSAYVEEEMSKNSVNITSDILKSEEEIINSSSSSDFDVDEDDFEDVNNIIVDEEENLTQEQIQEISNISEKHLRAEILQKIIQAGKTIDTSQFVVSNKVINLKDALKNTDTKVQRTAIWPMTYAGRPFKASALKGPEIALLADADDSSNANSVGLTIDQAKIMFEHDANPYRPSTVEAWAKTIPFLDVDNIFAALYVASLRGSNYIPNVCPKNSCQYSYLTDNLDIKDMVKFNNDNAKKRFNEIKEIELTPENTGAYESVVSVINDKFAVGIKIPSIFTILYEYGSLNSDFVKKYMTPVSIIQYVDYIYLINPETQQYQPIGWKTYPGDYTKSFKSKIATYAKILRELDDTDFSILIALINSMVTKASENRGIYFEIPETNCPKCGSKIEAREISPRGLVFMRQRLVELATTPTEK